MEFWGNKKEVKEEKSRPDRIKNMNDVQLRGWLNSSVMEMGAVYDRWAFSRGEAQEFDNVLNIVNDLWNEIRSRTPE